ncbi:MAG: yaeT [Chitinophagaceae bacterium]|nr:yaeT [Chitinophagaceae bacterium]
MKSRYSFFLLLLLLTQTRVFGQSIDFGSTFSTEVDYTTPKDYIIGGIEITGVKFLDPAAVISLTNLKIGDPISIPGDDISNAIKKLWDQGLVGDVEVQIQRIEGNTIFLEFKLTERPRLASFQFNGLSKAQREDIEGKVDISRGRIVTDALIKNAQKKVREYFLEKGYLNAEVLIVPQKDTALQNHVVLNVTVNKKSKVKIHRIHFFGVDQMPVKKLKQKMKKTKEKTLMNIFTSSKFIKKEYESDKNSIIEYYNSKGYRDAVIVKDSVYKHKKKRLNIDITISEGKKYYFRNIIWKGNYLYTDKALGEILDFKKGDIYNYEALEKKLNYNPNGPDISSLYLDNGYLFFSVDPVEVLVEGDSIDLEMRVYEGGQATIRNITIAGNTKTHDHVILREVRTLPGEKFSRADIIRTQRELATMNYFDNEQIGINPVPDPRTETVDIHYTVVEKPSDQIELSGGWGGYYGFVGTLGVVFNNFSLRNIRHFKTWSPLPSGDGQRLSIRFQANGRQYQSYSMSFTEPWLGGRKPNALTVSLSKSVQHRFGTSGETIGKLAVNGVTVSLGKRLKWPDDYFTATYSVSFLQYVLSNYPFNSTGIGYSSGRTTSFALNYSIARNSLNDFQFPTRGSNITLAVSLTPPYSVFDGVDYGNKKLDPAVRFRFMEYNKWMFDNSWFATIVPGKKRNLVWNVRTHLGFISSYKGSTGIGPFERFIMGGSGLSGYNYVLGYDVIGLRGYQDNSIGGSGGVAYGKIVSEIRYPVMNSPAFSLFVLAFFEAGNNVYKYEDFTPSNLYRSAGFGARVFMPAFGLLGVDWGVPLDDVPGYPNPNRTSRVTFTIGQQIR